MSEDALVKVGAGGPPEKPPSVSAGALSMPEGDGGSLVYYEDLSALISQASACPYTQADVLYLMLMGREVGLGPIQSLRSVHIIEGRPTMSADTMAAIVKASDLCEYFYPTEMTSIRCSYVTKRVGEPTEIEFTFTIEDAQRAGLQSEFWLRYPTAMLKARTITHLCRAIYPDLLGGFYDPTEITMPMSRPPVTEPNAPFVQGKWVDDAVPERVLDECKPKQLPDPHRAERQHLVKHFMELVAQAVGLTHQHKQRYLIFCNKRFGVEHLRQLDQETLQALVDELDALDNEIDPRTFYSRRAEHIMETAGMYPSQSWRGAMRRFKAMLKQCVDTDVAEAFMEWVLEQEGEAYPVWEAVPARRIQNYWKRLNGIVPEDRAPYIMACIEGDDFEPRTRQLSF